MKSIRRPLLIVMIALGLVIASAANASAATIWQTGTKLSSTPSFATMPGNVWIVEPAMYAEDAHGCQSGAKVAVGALRTSGDYIYVKDTCADGRSAVARYKPLKAGATDTRICRNSSGSGTWVRCNFNWPETVDACFTAGVYNPSTGFHKYDELEVVCGKF